jgi:two-component system, sensor histidine kinase
MGMRDTSLSLWGNEMVDHRSKIGLRLPEWLRASLQPATFICLLMIAVLWTALTSILVIEHQRTLDSAIQQGSNLARLFEENVASMLRDVDRTLLLLRQAYKEDPAHLDVGRWVDRTNPTNNLIILFTVVGPDGYARALNAPDDTALPTYVGDRDSFKKQRDAENDELLISKPTLGRLSNRWSILLSRRLRKPDGSFAGAIVASVDPQFIGDFY